MTARLIMDEKGVCCLPGIKKQTHPVLSVERKTRTSSGEKLSEGACSEREHAFHLGNHHQPHISRK
jgi:hypothetical protein